MHRSARRSFSVAGTAVCADRAKRILTARRRNEMGDNDSHAPEVAREDDAWARCPEMDLDLTLTPREQRLLGVIWLDGRRNHYNQR